MIPTDKLGNNGIIQELTSLAQRQFTGKVEVDSKGKKWKLYFCLSRLIWADGGPHPNRSWQRHLFKYCGSVDTTGIDLPEAAKFECWNYQILMLLMKNELINREQSTNLIQSKIAAVLFDVVQAEATDGITYEVQPIATDKFWELGLNISVAVMTLEQDLRQLEKDWSAWCQRGLQKWSPNLAPIIRQPEALKQAVSEVAYQNFTKLFQGNFSLRDLAVRMNQDVLRLTASLGTYVVKGWIELVEIPDLPMTSGVTTTKTNQEKPPLIACIDDSPQIIQIMKQIIKKAGYRFVGIQESLKAVTGLIKTKPNLIFLDIGMPILNGYEVCSQIKKTGKLQDIPVIILTSNDGMVDRMRAKLVGSSGFLGKPIQEEKVLTLVKKFLLKESSEANKISQE